ncbi:MAG TPA: M13 family peptidase [Polyangiaceae bacterium]|nr:M13 family peptidase [Polyangiaceae bacterium]
MRALAAPLSFGLSLFLVAACGPDRLPPIPESPGPVVKDVSLADVGLDASAMNRDADPCVDFYEFACGGWVKSTEIPGDKPRWVRSFSEIHQRNERDLERILEEAQRNPQNPVQDKIGTFYGACMNEQARNAAGAKPIQPLLDLVASYAPPPPSEDDGKPEKKTAKKAPPAPEAPTPPLSQILGELHRQGIAPFFHFTSTQDFRDATQVIAEVDQGGLGLPDRDYYLEDDEKMVEIRAFYLDHVAKMLALAGESEAAAKEGAAIVMKIETELARISKSRVERRDPEGIYNRLDREGLTERKGFDWPDYLKRRGLSDVMAINVTSVPFVDGFSDMASKLPTHEVAIYMKWHVLNATASELSDAFVEQDFQLAKKLFGQDELEARWKRCVAATDSALGELLAQAYVAERFGPESKQAVIEMVSEIGKAMRKRLGGLEWMDTKTRERARDKLDQMDYLIGYPDEWRTYEFELDADSHATNVLRASAWEQARDLHKIGKPVDRGEWFMTPPTVNAYYSPLRNHMVFPAGILQPPFYDPKASVPVNMGAMGMVVGHELTHGFDDKGSQFDAKGNLSGWWDDMTRKAFEVKTKCVEEQYGNFEALPGVKLNGKLTLGENIADAGGVKLAFHAYRAMRENAPEVTIAEGLDEDQQFFVSLGQIWCAKYREEFARARAKTDTHSQPNWRVNGSLMNTPDFAAAFNCAEGTPMNPKNRCEVW